MVQFALWWEINIIVKYKRIRISTNIGIEKINDLGFPIDRQPIKPTKRDFDKFRIIYWRGFSRKNCICLHEFTSLNVILTKILVHNVFYNLINLLLKSLPSFIKFITVSQIIWIVEFTLFVWICYFKIIMIILLGELDS